MARDVEQDELEMMLVSHIWSNRNKLGVTSQNDLIPILGWTKSKISRTLIEAEKLGYWATVSLLTNEQISLVSKQFFVQHQALVAKLESLTTQAGLPSLLEVSVFFAGPVVNGVASPENIQQFAMFAASRLEELLPRIKHLGVSWGKTPAAIASQFVQRARVSRRNDDFVAFPMCGESMDYAILDYSASVIAANLHRAITGKSLYQYSLGSIPARIPKSLSRIDFEPEHASLLRTFFEECGSYRRIFNEDEGLLSNADTLLCTAGAIYKDPSDAYMRDLITFEEIEPQNLSQWTIGDIAGYFLPRNSNGEGADEISNLNERWIGVHINHLRACCQRANDSNTTGVILASVGGAKAEIVREVIRRGFVNRIWIDHDLATELLKDVELPLPLTV